MSSKTRGYCASEGCHADTCKKGRYGYMADIKFFPSQHIHYLEISPVVDWNYLQVSVP